MKRYKNSYYPSTTLRGNERKIAPTLEEKIERMMSNKDSIPNEAPLIYQERGEGVGGSYNIRSDKWEVALDATDIISRNKAVERENRNANKADLQIVKDEPTHDQDPANEG